MKNLAELFEFIGRFSDGEWDRMMKLNSSGLEYALTQEREDAEAFATGVLGYLPEKTERVGVSHIFGESSPEKTETFAGFAKGARA